MSFVDFASAHGLAIKRLHADGKIHRCPTHDKPRSDNGAYLLDGERGWIQNWAVSEEVHWWNDPQAKPWSAEEKAAAERKRRDAAKERMRLAAKAADDAARMLGDAEFVIPDPGREWKPGRPAVAPVHGHPYLVRKGFALEPFYMNDKAELLVPMRDLQDYSRLLGLQRIAADGEKRFLTGQRAKGAVLVLGDLKDRDPWLVEGYATGLSVRMALRKLYRQSAVIVCFSAGNIEHVASLKFGTYVFADHDVSGRGEQAAKTTGLKWLMSPTEGQDGNDLHLADGIEAVCELIRSV